MALKSRYKIIRLGRSLIRWLYRLSLLLKTPGPHKAVNILIASWSIEVDLVITAGEALKKRLLHVHGIDNIQVVAQAIQPFQLLLAGKIHSQ